MVRVKQSKGVKGSLKWLQIAVNEKPELLNAATSKAAGLTDPIVWMSPRADDDFAEYRDREFLKRIDCSGLAEPLQEFWPKLGPQWDGLAVAGKTRILVEAKSHIAEMCSSPPAAGVISLTKITRSLNETASFLNARPAVPWGPYFYQLANRIAHLRFLRAHGIDARLVLLNFLGDHEQGGPVSVAEWKAAYTVASHVLGLPAHHKLTAFITHVYFSVAEFQSQS